jgi:hypothetical protein
MQCSKWRTQPLEFKQSKCDEHALSHSDACNPDELPSNTCGHIVFKKNTSTCTDVRTSVEQSATFLRVQGALFGVGCGIAYSAPIVCGWRCVVCRYFTTLVHELASGRTDATVAQWGEIWVASEGNVPGPGFLFLSHAFYFFLGRGFTMNFPRMLGGSRGSRAWSWAASLPGMLASRAVKHSGCPVNWTGPCAVLLIDATVINRADPVRCCL